MELFDSMPMNVLLEMELNLETFEINSTADGLFPVENGL